MQLAKEQKISLVKGGDTSIEVLRFGINWGQITKSSGFLGFGKKTKSVDLDAAAFCFDVNGNFIRDCFTNLLGGKLDIGYLLHSGDDLHGDESKNDSDNEIITAFISKIPENVNSIVFTVNSFSREYFDEIPYVGVRIYEGPVNMPNKVHATFNLENDINFKNMLCAALGKLYRRNGGWNFEAIGGVSSCSGINNIRNFAKTFA